MPRPFCMKVSMIDTVHKKTAFLTQVKAELGLSNVTVYTARVEQLQVSDKFDVITSRAFADLSDFVNWSSHLLADGGRYIALKGVAPKDEQERLHEGQEVVWMELLEARPPASALPEPKSHQGDLSLHRALYLSSNPRGVPGMVGSLPTLRA